MAADINDKFTEATNGTRPVPTTLTSLKAIGASSISCGALTGWPTATAVHFIIYTTNVSGAKIAGSQTDWKGIVSGTSITDLVLKAGTDNGYSVGAIVEAAPTAAWADDLTEGLLVSLDQDGTLKTGAVDVTAVIADGIITKAKLATAEKLVLDSGWALKTGDTTLAAPNTITYNGNRSYDLVFSSVDYTSFLSEGMRLRLTRTVSAPTQCADLEASSSQYFSSVSAGLAGMTFTDDFTCMAWVKLESYTAGTIISRYNGTNGWYFDVNGSGQVRIGGSAGAGDRLDSYQSIPLGKWVHVAGSLNMSASTGEIYIDGVLVPSSYTNGANTSLTQAGDLAVGAANATTYFDGKIAQVAVFSSVLSASTIRSYMSQTLSGSESTLVSAFSCNNSLLDLNTTNNNDLTANGGALMTNVDSPFGNYLGGTLEYAIISAKPTFSTNTTVTVQVPEGCAIPTSGGVSAVAYSTQAVPYGLPADNTRFDLVALYKAQFNNGAITAGNYTNIASAKLSLATGSWDLSQKGYVQCVNGAAPANMSAAQGLSTSASSFSADLNRTVSRTTNVSVAATEVDGNVYGEAPYSVTSATDIYLVQRAITSNATIYINGVITGDSCGDVVIRAKLTV